MEKKKWKTHGLEVSVLEKQKPESKLNACNGRMIRL